MNPKPQEEVTLPSNKRIKFWESLFLFFLPTYRVWDYSGKDKTTQITFQKMFGKTYIIKIEYL